MNEDQYLVAKGQKQLPPAWWLKRAKPVDELHADLNLQIAVERASLAVLAYCEEGELLSIIKLIN